MNKPFQQTQLSFTEYLRNPAIPATLIQQNRKSEIYRDLVYKNINHCIATTLPICKSHISEIDWRQLILDFIAKHHCETPYFLEICQEFLSYLMSEQNALKHMPPFFLELAHFEWIQMHLYLADIDSPSDQRNTTATLSSLWKVSPLVIGLTYSYPVHQIESFSAQIENEATRQIFASPTYLLVYRNQSDDVQIFEADRVALRIVELFQSNEGIGGLEIYQKLVAELDAHSEKMTLEEVVSLLIDLSEREILLYFN